MEETINSIVRYETVPEAASLFDGNCYRGFFEKSPEAFFILEVTEDGRFRYLAVNRSFETMTGISRDELIGRYIGETISSETAMLTIEECRRCIEGGGATSGDVELELSFRLRVFRWFLTPTRNIKGRICRIDGIVKDVTDEKRNEKAQEKFEINERYLATILNITSEGFYIVAPDQRFLQVNDAYCAMTGFSRDELLRMTVPEMDAAMTESEFERALEAYHETGSALFETKQKHKDGGIIDVEVYVNKIDEEGVEAVTFCRDITGRKRIEERNRQLTSDLSISLRERETLIRELYHRTKNNMQIIVSLLHIYGSEINDDSVKNVFEDMAFRINSMALVQNELYESRNLQHINMQLYLSKLTGQISESYRNPERRIAISAFSEDITLTVETAIPLGLIVNELIINSLRHAFKGREQGQINVELYKKENERLQLIVSDNGIGVPDGFSLEKEAHMGLTTVISLSHEQLMGSIIFESKDGLRVSLEFLVQS